MYKYAMMTANDIEADDLLNNLEDSVSALSALSNMLETYIREGNIEEDDSHGIYLLIRQQSTNVGTLTETLRWKIRDIRYSKVELNDVHKVAELVNLPWPTVASVVTLATGLYYGDQDKHFAETENEERVKEAVR